MAAEIEEYLKITGIQKKKKLFRPINGMTHREINVKFSLKKIVNINQLRLLVHISLPMASSRPL